MSSTTIADAPVAAGTGGGRKFEVPYAWIALVLIVAGWQLACSVLEVPNYLLPSPAAIAADLAGNVPYFLPHVAMTAAEILIGFGISILVAIPLAVILTFSRLLNRALYPLIVGSQVIPKVAIAPVMLAWFGFGMSPKVAIIVTIAFFPIVINAVVGLRSASPQMIYLAQSMGATRMQIFWHFRLPQAVPSLLAGIKMAAVLAVIGAVVAEFVGADSGLGYVILSASSNFDITRQFSAILLLSALGMFFFWITELAERRVIPWHISVRSEH
jgi:ABC-type nitrate/sulfonate/bicarbonate transport system permease component